MNHVCTANGLGYCPCAQGPREFAGKSVASNVAAIFAVRAETIREREASPDWRGWTVRLVFRRGQPILGVGRLDGADNSCNMPEARAAVRQRLDLSRKICQPLARTGLTRSEANTLNKKLSASLGADTRGKRGKAPRRKRRG